MSTRRSGVVPFLGPAEARLLRARAQGLVDRSARHVAEAVMMAGALQAQDTRAARLAVRCRTSGVDADAVDSACTEERSVVRTWLMRGTLHMVPAEDVTWMVGLLGPRFAAADRRRRLELGLDDDTCARALPAIRDALAERAPLSRAGLVTEVRSRGIAIDPTGQAPAHLVAYAAMRGLVCRGPELEGDEPSYVLLEDWVGRQPACEPERALAELARRYLTGHGPATPADFACWSGLEASRARQGFQLIAPDLVEVEVAGESTWTLAPASAAETPPRSVRLLPAFDAYLLGYRSRDLALDPRFAGRIQAGGGWIHPALLVDGLVVGTWRLRARGRGLAVHVEPFEELAADVLPGLEAEVEDVGRFLGREAALAGPDAGRP